MNIIVKDTDHICVVDDFYESTIFCKRRHALLKMKKCECTKDCPYFNGYPGHNAVSCVYPDVHFTEDSPNTFVLGPDRHSYEEQLKRVSSFIDDKLIQKG